MKPNRTICFAMGAITALVLGSGTAYAATGGKFIIGKANSETSTTTLSNSRGTALALNSKAGTPPLKVNRTTKVPNLNADRLDGKDSTAFALSSATLGTVTGVGSPTDFDDDGTDDAIVATAQCPAGSQLTGGGAEDGTSDGYVAGSEPLDNRTWAVVVFSSDLSAGNAAKVTAFARCWDPQGRVAADLATTQQSGPTALQLRTLDQLSR